MENTAVRNGILLGGILAVLSLVMGFTMPKFYISMGANLLYIIVIVFMVKTAREQRAEQRGLLSFGEAFVAVFTCMSIGLIFSNLIMYVQSNFLHPGFEEITREIAIEAMDKMEGAFSGFLGEDGKEAMEQGMEQAREEMETQSFKLTIGQTILGYFVSLMVGAVVSVIISAIMKKG